MRGGGAYCSTLHGEHAWNYVVAKLDFSNAFNCLHRDFMLERVAEMVSELYRFCH